MRPGPAPRIWVQTRGTARAADYAFLCGGPPHPWWRDYREATAFDHPTVLVVSDGGGWAAYLSGIPSARTDAVGTVVRYTLVLDGPCGEDPVADRLPTAVATWLDDVAHASPHRPGRLSAALDARFPADDVQRWIDAPEPLPGSPDDDRSVIGEPGRRVLDAVATLAVPGPGVDVPGDWIGAAGAAAARAAFVARVTALVAGAPGRALLLNLVDGQDDLAGLRDPASPLGVLVETADRALARPVALPPVVGAKKAPPAAERAASTRPAAERAASTRPAAARRTGRAAATLAAVPVLAVLTVVALVVTVLVLVL